MESAGEASGSALLSNPASATTAAGPDSPRPVPKEATGDAKDTSADTLEARVDKLAGLVEGLLKQRSFGDALKQVADAGAPVASVAPKPSRRLVGALRVACAAGDSSSAVRSKAPVRPALQSSLAADVEEEEDAEPEEDTCDQPHYTSASSASEKVVQDMVDNVQVYGGSFMMWLENASGLAAKDQRAYHEVRTLCQALDICDQMRIFSTTSPLVQLLCRRVLGVHMSVMMGNWALCDAVAMQPSHNILASQQVVADAVRTASRQLSLANRAAFNRFGRGRGRGRGRGNGSFHGRGRQGRDAPSSSSAKSAAAAASTGAGAQ